MIRTVSRYTERRGNKKKSKRSMAAEFEREFIRKARESRFSPGHHGHVHWRIILHLYVYDKWWLYFIWGGDRVGYSALSRKTGYSYGFGREGLETKSSGKKWRPAWLVKWGIWMPKRNRKDVSSYLRVNIDMFKSQQIYLLDGKLDV